MSDSYKILNKILFVDEINYFKQWAMDSKNPHRGRSTDGKYYHIHDGEREYEFWWTTQPPQEKWVPIVKRINKQITTLMQTNEWTIYVVDCITTAPDSNQVHAHIDFPYKFEETKNMDGVLGVQIIIPLDDFTKENGGTMFMPYVDKSYTFQHILDNQKTFNEYLLTEGTQLIASAGDALMYDGRTLHSTMPNKSEKYRSALLINALRNDCLGIVQNNDINTDSTNRTLYRNNNGLD